jgi:hypothetical protein
MPINVITFSLTNGDSEKTVLYSTFPNDHNIAKIPMVKKQSPTLLVKNADIEL